MSLNYVTLTLDLADGQGTPLSAGTAYFVPTAQLTDTTDHAITALAPVTARFGPGGYPAVKLLATDNAAPLPNGWAWQVTFSGVPGSPAPMTFFLPFASGASQFLSSQAPVSTAPATSPFLTGSGTPQAGQFVEFTGTGFEVVPVSGTPGGVDSVTAADTSVVVAGTGTDPTVRTGTLDVIATQHPPAAAWSNNAKKITSVANGTASSDVAAFGQIGTAVAVETSRAEAAEALLAPLASPALTGTPTAPTASPLTDDTQVATTAYADAAVAVETSRAETAEAGLLPLAGGTMSGAIAMGSHKVTGVANGSAAQDAAAFGQIPSSLPPSGSAGGVLSGSYPNPGFATTPLPESGGTMTGRLAPAVVGLTDGSSVAIDSSQGNVFDWPLGGSSHTLATPSNPVNGDTFRVRIAYSGSFTPLFSAAYSFGADGQPTWTATSGKVDQVAFEYDVNITKWCCLGSKLGFS